MIIFISNCYDVVLLKWEILKCILMRAIHQSPRFEKMFVFSKEKWLLCRGTIHHINKWMCFLDALYALVCKWSKIAMIHQLTLKEGERACCDHVTSPSCSVFIQQCAPEGFPIWCFGHCVNSKGIHRLLKRLKSGYVYHFFLYSNQG